MNNKCIYLKQKLYRKLYCKKLGIYIRIGDCKNCPYKKYKDISKYKIKTRTSKQSKLERNRFSIIQEDTTKCALCSSTYQLTWHEIFAGRNKPNSMKYGLCLRICLNCHRIYQHDLEFNNKWHKIGQKKFIEVYPELDFVDIFKRNYL